MKTNDNDIVSQYRKAKEASAGQEEIVDVLLPSGVTFKFAKPSSFDFLFHYGQMPQASTSGAVQSWIDSGVLNPGDLKPEEADHINLAMKIRDRVLELSRVPKLVVGEATRPGEMSTDELTEADSAFLFRWCATGGKVAHEVTTFPARSGQDAVVSPNRKGRRTASKRTCGSSGKVRAA